MAYSATVLSVMIASPSDVVAERNVAREIISKWNIVHSMKDKVVLLPIGWDTHSSPDLSGRPQSLINERILKNADLLLGIFWTRLGSPTGGFKSGSVEEVEHHLGAGKPAMLYFSEKLSPPAAIDAEQFQALQEFKKTCFPRGIVESFETEDDFREKFRDQLQQILSENQYLKGIIGLSSAQTIHPVPAAPVHRISGGKLSSEAKRLLVEGAKDEHGMIYHRRSIDSEAIIANKHNFTGENPSPRDMAVWLEALAQLTGASFIVPVGNESIYKLTAQGFKVADVLIGTNMSSDVVI